jgi:hypothetical protein
VQIPDKFSGMATTNAASDAKGTDIPQLMRMSQSELDELFRHSPPGEIPDGDAEGTAIVAPGTRLEDPAARLIHLIAWQGKVFDKDAGELRNKILPTGVHAIAAKVYVDKSWFDGKECIALDYSNTSLVAHWIRDEIRLVGPGVYLGIVFWDRTRLIHFALKFSEGTSVGK